MDLTFFTDGRALFFLTLFFAFRFLFLLSKEQGPGRKSQIDTPLTLRLLLNCYRIFPNVRMITKINIKMSELLAFLIRFCQSNSIDLHSKQLTKGQK